MEDHALKMVVGTTAHAPLSLVDPTARLMNVKNVTFMPCVQTDTANANMATLGMDINVKKRNLIVRVAVHLLAVKTEFVFVWNISLETATTVNLHSHVTIAKRQTFVSKAPVCHLVIPKSQK